MNRANPTTQLLAMFSAIDPVVQRLNSIIEDATAEQSPAGYFPTLYCRVTKNVQQAILKGEFSNNERMEALVVVFASRYLDAYQAFQAGEKLTHSWKLAFNQHSNSSLIVLQHLLLGMNAHINLDLGMAAAQVSSKDDILSLKEDFIRINDILGGLINHTQRHLTRIFGPLGLVDNLLGSVDERLSLFSISYARDKAWSQTLELTLANEDDQKALISERDNKVAAFAETLIQPPKLSLRLLLWIIRKLERGDTATRIRMLSQ